MRIYIIQKTDKYSIYKVADNLIHDFLAENQSMIVVEGKNIQEAIIKFDEIVKQQLFDFDTKLLKYKVSSHLKPT